MTRLDDKIYEGLREKSKGFKLPVSDALWEAIESDVDIIVESNERTKKRKRGLWWFFSGIAATLVGVGLFSFNFFSDNEYDQSSADSSGQLQKNQKESTTETSYFDRQLVDEELVEVELNETTLPTAPTQRLNLDEAATLDFMEKISTEKSSTKKEEVGNIVAMAGDDQLSKEKEYDPITDRNNKLIENTNNDRKDITKELKDRAEPAENIKTKRVDDDKEDLTRALEATDHDDSIIEGADDLGDKPTREVIQDQAAEIATPEDTIEKEFGENRKDKKHEKVSYGSSDRFNLMVSVGAGVSYRSLSSQLAPNLINHRNQHEGMGLTQNFGLAGQIGLFRRSFLRVGLFYQKYTDRYDFTHVLIQHATVNDYAYLQLPVLYGHKMLSLGKKSDLFVLGGLKFNRLYEAQSSWVDPDVFQAVAHNNKVDIGTFKKWAYVLKFGFEYRRRVGENWNLHVTPTVDGFVNSVYENAEFLNQKPYSFQMNFGLSYRF